MALSEEQKNKIFEGTKWTLFGAFCVASATVIVSHMNSYDQKQRTLEEACNELSAALESVPVLNEEAIRAAVGDQAVRLIVQMEPLTELGEDNFVPKGACDQIAAFSTHEVADLSGPHGFIFSPLVQVYEP